MKTQQSRTESPAPKKTPESEFQEACLLYNDSLGGRPERRKHQRVSMSHGKRIHGERYPGPHESNSRRRKADEELESTRRQLGRYWLNEDGRRKCPAKSDCGLTLEDLQEMRECGSQFVPGLDSFEMTSLIRNVVFDGERRDLEKLRELIAPPIKKNLGPGRPSKRDWRDDLLQASKEDLRMIDAAVGIRLEKAHDEVQRSPDPESGDSCLKNARLARWVEKSLATEDNLPAKCSAHAIRQLADLLRPMGLSGKKRLAHLSKIAARCEGVDEKLLHRYTEKVRTQTNAEQKMAFKVALKETRQLFNPLATNENERVEIEDNGVEFHLVFYPPGEGGIQRTVRVPIDVGMAKRLIPELNNVLDWLPGGRDDQDEPDDDEDDTDA
jgi:hypothetical protein